jgi:excisionase family DNA binding protein
MAEQFYTIEQVAERLNCNPRTARDLIKENKLKGYKKLRKWYVLHSDLLEYIKSE